MLSFQVYANKASEDEDRKESQMGLKVRRLKEFIAAHSDGEISAGEAEEIASKLSAIEKSFRKHGLSDFISTLTPGAQNAIYAASFAWGYENAARSVKSAMKLDEVKHAQDSEERSRAVIESIQKQSGGAQEQNKSVSKFVWGFYNEDMKETQAVAGKSETLIAGEREKEKEEQERVPLSAPEAVALGMLHGTHNAELSYVVASGQATEEARQRQEEAQKKEELARIVPVSPMKQKAEEEKVEKERLDAAILSKIREEEHALGVAAEKISNETVAAALQRKEEMVREYERMEKNLQEAINKLDSMAETEAVRVRKIAAMLPRELEQFILSREKYFAKKGMLRKQLVRWIAFSREGRQGLLKMPLNRLIKMLSLSNLFK